MLIIVRELDGRLAKHRRLGVSLECKLEILGGLVVARSLNLNRFFVQRCRWILNVLIWVHISDWRGIRLFGAGCLGRVWLTVIVQISEVDVGYLVDLGRMFFRGHAPIFALTCFTVAINFVWGWQRSTIDIARGRKTQHRLVVKSHHIRREVAALNTHWWAFLDCGERILSLSS